MVAQTRVGSNAYERSLINMLEDPCGAPLVPGLGLAGHGICVRFSQILTPSTTGTENAFYYLFDPQQAGVTGIVKGTGVAGSAAVQSNIASPGSSFLQTNADSISVLGACVQLMYVGSLVNRKGYVGVIQGDNRVLGDIATTSDIATILASCQSVAPVTSATVEVKYAPKMADFNTTAATREYQSSDNSKRFGVVCVGVNPNDFIVRVTYCVEYLPKLTMGLPATTQSKVVPPGAPERLMTYFARRGDWWHNLGRIAKEGTRLAYSMTHTASQVYRTITNSANVGEAAAGILALTM